MANAERPRLRENERIPMVSSAPPSPDSSMFGVKRGEDRLFFRQFHCFSTLLTKGLPMIHSIGNAADLPRFRGPKTTKPLAENDFATQPVTSVLPKRLICLR
jgi:hypothetical protein